MPQSDTALFDQIRYALERQKVELGHGLTLDIEALGDLNQTIDQVFELLEREGRSEMLERLCPYFGVIWPSALAVTCELAKLPGSALQGISILEFGCGLALPSLFAATRGARVIASDSHPEVPRFLERNRELNPPQLGGSLEYRACDWMSPDSAPLGSFDRVIATDVLYERHYAAPVAGALARATRPGGTIWLADPGRPYLQSFADEMKALGLHATTRILPTPPGAGVKEVFLLEFMRG